MELLLNKIFWSIFILFIWFKTDAFTQYLSRYKWVKMWISYKDINPDIDFPDFIFLKNPNFLTKLLSCQPCFLFWIVIIVSLFMGFSNFPIVYLSSYFIFRKMF